VKSRGPSPHGAVSFVAPGGQDRDVEPARGRLVDHLDDPVEVGVVGARGIVAVEGFQPERARFADAVELGERDGLNDVEALLGAHAEVVTRLVARRGVEERPRRVAEPEKRPAGFGFEVVAARMDPQGGQRRSDRGGRNAKRD
jgi:hypothetical protein